MADNLNIKFVVPRANTDPVALAATAVGLWEVDPATGNRWLLTDVLRDAFGFKGFVVSDANAAKSLEVQHFANDATDAGARALKAGHSLQSGFSLVSDEMNEPIGPEFKTTFDQINFGFFGLWHRSF